ncbi:hypothetical protein BY458DRAFT_480565 [Sporodiniella umbellata]|nr:hypothetical protein BY458DRAFT_480565 [Sporodiniella umbellata]
MTLFSSDKKKEKDNDSEKDYEIYNSNYQRDDILLCATNGKIYALHKKTGSKLWGTGFPTGAMGGVISIFVTDYDKVIAGANGKTSGLNLLTGETLWVNKMPSFGYQEVSVISTPSRILKPTKEPSTDAPPEYNEPVQFGKPVIIACSMGKVLAIDPDNGQELWRYGCPGGGFSIPVAIIDPPSLENDKHAQCVYVGSGKWVYCLEAYTGQVVWSSKVSSSLFGCGYMTLATPWNSRLAAEAYTAFSQNPSAQAREVERQAQASS